MAKARAVVQVGDKHFEMQQFDVPRIGADMVRTTRPSRPCEGLAREHPSALSQNVLNPDTEAVSLPRQIHLHLEVQPGDRVFHAISGSGGHGDPWEREPASVQRDVQDGKVTIDGTRQHYGVVIEPQRLRIDWGQTQRIREREKPGV